MSNHPSSGAAKRVASICNGLFGDRIARGDIHFLRLAGAAAEAGYELHFIGGHASENQLKPRFARSGAGHTLQSQFRRQHARLFWNFFCRFIRTMGKMNVIWPDNAVYALSDYWFDVLPDDRFTFAGPSNFTVYLWDGRLGSAGSPGAIRSRNPPSGCDRFASRGGAVRAGGKS